MKGRIHHDSMVHEYRLLRNRIEAEVHAPALILVTSATDRDGAGITAYGLAESLSKTHQRTVLVTTDSTVVAPAETSMPSSQQPALRRRATDRLESSGHVTGGDGRFSVVYVSPERIATISRSSVASLVQGLRSEHDYVVIDAGDLPKNSFGLLLIASADATLLAFRAGRAQQPADRVMLDMLERAESKVLGVVMTDMSMIDTFAQRDEPVVVKEPAHEGKPLAAFAGRVEVALQRVRKVI